MIKLFALSLLLNGLNIQASGPISSAKLIVMPSFPKLPKMAHDAKLVTVKVKLDHGRLLVLGISGGNKYFDNAIKSAILEWSFPKNLESNEEFVIKFDFRLSKDLKDENKYVIDFENSTIIIWEKERFSPTTD